MSSEKNVLTYTKSNNIIIRSFREINKSLELNEKEIRILSIFAILRILDLALTFIFYNKKNSYHYVRFIDYILLFSSFLVTFLIFINKENIRQRTVILSILFNIIFICFDITSFILYFICDVQTIIILISLILNALWLIITLIIFLKVIKKCFKFLKVSKKGNKSTLHGNSSSFR